MGELTVIEQERMMRTRDWLMHEVKELKELVNAYDESAVEVHVELPWLQAERLVEEITLRMTGRRG